MCRDLSLLELAFYHPSIGAPALSSMLLAAILSFGNSEKWCTASQAEVGSTVESSRGPLSQVEKSLKAAEIEQSLRSFREKNGRAPNADDLWALLTEGTGEPQVSAKEVGVLVSVFKEIQQPMISKSDLLELHRATRDSVVELHTIAEIRVSTFKDGKLESVSVEEQEYAQDKGKLLLRVHRPAAGDSRAYTRVTAYDGEHLQLFNEENGIRSGAVTFLETRSQFYRIENLLFLTMLVDIDAATGSKSIIHDLENFAAPEQVIVFEAPRTFKGIDCLSVGLFGLEAWFDPMRNFALMRLERQKFIDGMHPRLMQVRELSNYEDFGNGIWLPRIVTTIDYDTSDETQRILRKQVVTFSQILVNKPIDPQLFSDVIPRGTLVNDGVKHLAYVVGRNGSIAQILDDTVSSPPARAHRILLIAINTVVLALVMAIVLWRRYKSNAV